MEEPKETEPVVISASRAEDLPAFRGDWLQERLREGFCLWRNPFNGSSVKVSFSKTRFIVFWSKNPKPFFKHLDFIDGLGLKHYFQFTLNDYSREGLEPGVPSLEERIESFQELSSLLGPERATP